MGSAALKGALGQLSHGALRDPLRVGAGLLPDQRTNKMTPSHPVWPGVSLQILGCHFLSPEKKL